MVGQKRGRLEVMGRHIKHSSPSDHSNEDIVSKTSIVPKTAAEVGMKWLVKAAGTVLNPLEIQVEGT